MEKVQQDYELMVASSRQREKAAIDRYSLKAEECLRSEKELNSLKGKFEDINREMAESRK